MKKLFLALLLIFIATTQAQVRNYTKKSSSSSASSATMVKRSKSSSSDDKPLQPILLGGFQYSTEVGDNLISNSGRSGFAAGLGINISTGNSLDIEIDALYGTMGSNFDGVKDELTYIQAPVLLNVKLGQKGFKLGIGPQVGYLIAAKFDGEDYKDFLNSIDGGVTVNFAIPFSNKTGLNIRGYQGLTNIYIDSPDFVVKNFAAYAGFYFKI